MAIAVEMPKMTDTMEEGVLVEWMVEEGSVIAAGDVIAQVETDKATMDVEAYDDGVLLKRVALEGDALPIGGLIAVLGKAGDDIAELLARYAGNGAPAAVGHAGAEPAESVPAATPAPETSPADIKASPLARRMAAKHGLDLRVVTGSGTEGRIVKRDIEAAIASRPQAQESPDAPPRQVAGARSFEAVRITQMRKAIARRLSQSKFSAPHFYLTVDVAMERAVAARRQLNTEAEVWGTHRISYNDLITKAAAAALRRHPQVNASYLDAEGEIRQYSYIDIGIAVAIGEGLVTPVVRDADIKSLSEIAEETAALAARARARDLQPEEFAGSTFTTSNLGMFGMEAFTAIINPPNACILAIGAIRDVPVVKDGAVTPGKRMKLSLSCDHRVVDGATGAEFLSTLQRTLEEPLTLLL